MIILTVNIGSTGVKYSVFDNTLLLDTGKTEDITSIIKHYQPQHIIHRIVFGGNMHGTLEVDDTIIIKLEKYNNFAPLHNPRAIELLKLIRRDFTKIINYITFDNNFHLSIKPNRNTYAIPQELANKHQIKKYGFHGLSHQYIASQVPHGRVINLHLGGGCSVCAIKDSISVATSMGFGPEEGLMMVKRSGNIGPSALLHLMEGEGYSISQIRDCVFSKSGFLGLTDSQDIKAIMSSIRQEDILAREIFVNNICDYIGSYYITLGGLDTLVFTGGIGENSILLRELVINQLQCLGAVLNSSANIDNELIISDSESSFNIMVILAREDITMMKVLMAIRS
jgi:acetate kinase